ncbi:MAG: hypothetical protein V7647_659 [Acidobacteriota bacterium]|jgi:hypothetical protein
MPSPKTIAALRIARALKPAELAMNEAAVRVLAMGSAMLTARADGTVHPLEGQEAVDHLGHATALVFGALKSLKAAHHELHGQAGRHEVFGEGVLDDSPDHGTPHKLVTGATAQAA